MVHNIHTCDICKEPIPGGNFTRHKKRKHNVGASVRPHPLPVEHSKTVSEVLLACDFDPAQLGNWDIKNLDLLPNVRHHTPTPRRHHTRWQIVTDENLSELPSLEDVLVDIGFRFRRYVSMTSGTELWRENENVQFTSQEWVA
jgi:hypothetical protein